MPQTQRFIVNGVTYERLEDMPPEVRKKWDATTQFFSAMFDGSKEGVPLQVQHNAIDPNFRRIALGFNILFWPVFVLAIVAMFSGVHTTVQYGREWMWLFAVVALALFTSIWMMRGEIAARTSTQPVTKRKLVVTVLGSALGMSVLAGFAVFGGIPILAHHMTARPGEMLVTVIATQDDYQRNACRPRLQIKEFTFFLHNHLCPSDQAFSEISVGQELHLLGQVSPYGIAAESMRWSRPRVKAKP